MRKHKNDFDIQNNVEHCKLMLVDWQSGLEKVNIIHKYGITEHAYKVFNKQCKDRGYKRAGSTKGSLNLMFDQIALQVYNQQYATPKVVRTKKSKVDKPKFQYSSSEEIEEEEEEMDVFGHKKTLPSYNSRFPIRR